jgi:hypothetical protein
MNQQAGTGIWHWDATKKGQEKQNKKGVQKRNINWQGSRRDDLEAVNQAFDANEGEIR